MQLCSTPVAICCSRTPGKHAHAHTGKHTLSLLCSFSHPLSLTHTSTFLHSRLLSLEQSLKNRVWKAQDEDVQEKQKFSTLERKTQALQTNMEEQGLGALKSCLFLFMCCSVLQCVAVCCSVLQCVAVCCRVFCSVLQYKVACPHSCIWKKYTRGHSRDSKVPRNCTLIIRSCSVVRVLQRVAACCSVLQRVAVFYSVLQCVLVCCSVLQCVEV